MDETCLKLWQRFDLNGDGAVDEQEFVTLLCQLNPNWTEARVKQLLDYFDTDRDGKLQVHEFFCWLFDQRRWIRQESRSRPGKYYWINSDTLESSWHWSAKARIWLNRSRIVLLCADEECTPSRFVTFRFLRRGEKNDVVGKELKFPLDEVAAGPDTTDDSVFVGTMQYTGGEHFEVCVWSSAGSAPQCIGMGTLDAADFCDGFAGPVSFGTAGSLELRIDWHEAQHGDPASSQNSVESRPTYYYLQLAIFGKPPASAEVLKKAFDEVNTDGSGAISKAQLLHAMNSVGITTTQSGVAKVFQMIDTNLSDDLDMEEWQAFFRIVEAMI